MKITVKQQQKPIKYPCLMKSDELIVFFIKKGKGVVLAEDDIYNTGDYEDDFSMKYFEPFDGEITLKNS